LNTFLEKNGAQPSRLKKHQNLSLETFAIAKFGTSFCNGHLPLITNFVKILGGILCNVWKNSFWVPLWVLVFKKLKKHQEVLKNVGALKKI
jgi:hypothetical protein